MDIKEEQQAKESHRKIIGKRLMTEKLIDVFEDGEYQLLYDYQSLQRNILAYKTDKARSELKEKPADSLHTRHFMERPLIDMDSEELILDLDDPKKRHHWIWSDQPNRGKTTFLLNLEEQFKAAFYNCDEKY